MFCRCQRKGKPHIWKPDGVEHISLVGSRTLRKWASRETERNLGHAWDIPWVWRSQLASGLHHWSCFPLGFDHRQTQKQIGGPLQHSCRVTFPCCIPLLGPHFLLPLDCGCFLTLASVLLKHFTLLHGVSTDLPIIAPRPIFYPYYSDKGSWLKLADMPHLHDYSPGYVTQDGPENCLRLTWWGEVLLVNYQVEKVWNLRFPEFLFPIIWTQPHLA